MMGSSAWSEYARNTHHPDLLIATVLLTSSEVVAACPCESLVVAACARAAPDLWSGEVRVGADASSAPKIAFTTPPSHTTSTLSTGTIERSAAVNFTWPAFASFTSPPTGCPPNVNRNSGPLVANVFPLFRFFNHSSNFNG